MSLYNCKSDGDHYRISKFTNDLDVEASYLTDGAECDCPAGHRPVCRHRIMLPRFIAKNATAGQWFHNYEQHQWIRAATDELTIESMITLPDNSTPEEVAKAFSTLGDLASAASELTATEVDERIRDYQGPMPGDRLIGAMVDSTMKTINLLELAKPISGSIPELPAHKFTGFEPKPLRRL